MFVVITHAEVTDPAVNGGAEPFGGGQHDQGERCYRIARLFKLVM